MALCITIQSNIYIEMTTFASLEQTEINNILTITTFCSFRIYRLGGGDNILLSPTQIKVWPRVIKRNNLLSALQIQVLCARTRRLEWCKLGV